MSGQKNYLHFLEIFLAHLLRKSSLVLPSVIFSSILYTLKWSDRIQRRKVRNLKSCDHMLEQYETHGEVERHNTHDPRRLHRKNDGRLSYRKLNNRQYISNLIFTLFILLQRSFDEKRVVLEKGVTLHTKKYFCWRVIILVTFLVGE